MIIESNTKYLERKHNLIRKLDSSPLSFEEEQELIELNCCIEDNTRVFLKEAVKTLREQKDMKHRFANNREFYAYAGDNIVDILINNFTDKEAIKICASVMKRLKG